MARGEQYFYSFWFSSNPTFAPVLPDDDVRLTASHLIRTTEREQWRREVVDYFLAKGSPPASGRNPRIYFVGGGTASGKTTSLQLLQAQGLFAPENPVFCNADDIKERDPIYQNLAAIGEYRAADVVHNDSAALVLQLVRRAVAEVRSDIVFDDLLDSTETVVDILNFIFESGVPYEPILIGFTVDADIALQRAFRRAVATKRYVPSTVIIGGHQRFSKRYPEFLQLFNVTMLYDNNGAAPVLLSYSNHSAQVVTDMNRYSQFLNKVHLNPSAQDITHLYDDQALLPTIIKNMYLGSCATSKETLEIYTRVFTLLQSPTDSCTCFQPPVTTRSYETSNQKQRNR